MTATAATTTASTQTLTPGTWVLDPSHSDVSFTVRHLMVSKVRGTFSDISGTITVHPDDELKSAVEAKIGIGSVDTRDEKRDAHLRSADFFDAEQHPTMTYRSTGLRRVGDGRYAVDGELTLRGVTRPVQLDLELNGVSSDPWGGTRAGFSASGEISRKDFGMEFNIPIDGGGVVVGDSVKISLEAEAILQADAAGEAA
jgi:polyisoprenoid-binding protein YceI